MPFADAESSQPLPLVTDLDDTLLRTDTLWEGLFCLLGQKPLAAFKLPGLAARGPLAVKRYLAEYSVQHAELFPVNAVVLAELEKAHNEGRKVYLASAALPPVAERIAARFPFFSGVFASDATNLKGEAKAKRLVQEFGAKGFDYIGDDAADVPVWHAARTALCACADARVQKAAARANSNCLLLSDLGRPLAVAPPAWQEYRKALRLHQWVKNILLFVPLLLAHDFSLRAFGLTLSAFFSFSCGASAIYVLNDLADLAADRQHPTKCKRPFAAGAIPLRTGLSCMAAMLLCALAPCVFLPWRYLGCLAIYLACAVGYTAWCKSRLMLDVVMLACMYVLRIIAGEAAIAHAMSNWLLAFGIFLFLGLALIKRIGDSLQHGAAGSMPAAIGQYIGPTPGRAYESGDTSILESMAVASCFAATLVAALYIDSLQAAMLYSRPQILWLFCPLFLYWYGRLLLITHRGGMGDDPVAYTVRDPNSWRCALCGLVLLLGAI
jgi:4-hydroxybenzoate polyprenyltransferase